MRVNAQETQFIISNNQCYKGISSVFRVIVENIPCNEIELISNFSKIKKGQKCYYYFEADSIGLATITLYKNKNGNKAKLGQTYFEVIDLPKTTAFAGG